MCSIMNRNLAEQRIKDPLLGCGELLLRTTDRSVSAGAFGNRPCVVVSGLAGRTVSPRDTPRPRNTMSVALR